MDFEIVKTDIETIPADAIVLPANPQLKEGSGASSSIFKAAGRKQLAEACSKIVEKHGSLSVGTAVPTQAFNLPAKYIIHTVVPAWIDGKHDEYNMLCAAYLSTLQIAELYGCKSIAFPLLSSGNNGFDPELALEIAKQSFESFNSDTIQHIILVIHGEKIASLVLNRGLQYSEPQEIVQPARYVSGIAISGASSGISDKMQGVNHRARFAQIFKKAKEAGISLAEDGLERAIEYIDKHHDEIFNYATTLVKKAIENAKEMKDTSSD